MFRWPTLLASDRMLAASATISVLLKHEIFCLGGIFEDFATVPRRQLPFASAVFALQQLHTPGFLATCTCFPKTPRVDCDDRQGDAKPTQRSSNRPTDARFLGKSPMPGCGISQDAGENCALSCYRTNLQRDVRFASITFSAIVLSVQTNAIEFTAKLSFFFVANRLAIDWVLWDLL